ncbi:MAG: hypothetical protein KatS3mg129_2355 [Leptospiraceae bacterium]|nr:MAG: hypothetical protein KatS3mg129_2355 [Leptospiraceae bacterium]
MKWIEVRDQIFTDFLQIGWNTKKKTFVQSYENDNLDASILLMPIVEFLDAKDPRIQSTVDRILSELVSDSLVFRYNVSETQDGFIKDEGTFSIFFWLAEVIARSDRIDEARIIFEKMLSYSNHLGLYSEEIGANGEALGNFPQAFTHIGLIRSAYYLDKAIENKRK